MAAQREDAPALIFSQFTEYAEGRVLINMLGASTRRYALSVGLDPDLPVSRLITETRRIMRRRIAPTRIAPEQACYWVSTDWCPVGQFPPAGTARTCE